MTSMTVMISYLTLYARVKRDYNAMIDDRGWGGGGRAAGGGTRDGELQCGRLMYFDVLSRLSLDDINKLLICRQLVAFVAMIAG